MAAVEDGDHCIDLLFPFKAEELDGDSLDPTDSSLWSAIEFEEFNESLSEEAQNIPASDVCEANAGAQKSTASPSSLTDTISR